MRKWMIRIALLLLVLSLLTPTVLAKQTVSSVMVHSKHYKENEYIAYPEVYNIPTNIAIKINAIMLDAAKKSYEKYLHVKAIPNKKTSFDSLYRVMYNSNGKLSIYYSEYTYLGGKKGTAKITFYNFDLKTGKRYVISDLLTSKKDYTRVRDYAYHYLRTHHPYAKSVKTKKDVKVTSKSRFIFADNGIYLFFTNYKQYEPSSYDDGDPYINIPSRIYK